MRTLIITTILTISLVKSYAQNSAEYLHGSVSYISSQNIYIKFDNTTGIHIGDTLFSMVEGKLKASILIKNISSISCVGVPLDGFFAELNKAVVAHKAITKPNIDVMAQKNKTAIAITDLDIEQSGAKSNKSKIDHEDNKQVIDGKITLSSYSTASADAKSSQRFRYNVAFDAQNIANSNFSTETYMSFTHKIGNWNGFSDALRIYSLSAKYDISKTATVSIGRKINLNMANVGAVDGLQFENNGRNFSYGAVLGFRPDTYNYSFNSKLLQYGAFVGHKLKTETGSMQTSLGILNQTNNTITDRRFAYFQHTNSLLKNLDLFCSFEVDLYGIINGQPSSTLSLTSTYVSLRYKPVKKLSLSLMYDARRNLYYYETFKNTVDSIYDRETRQGFRFQITYRPITNLLVGATAGYRMPSSTSSKSLNAYGYITHTNVPWLNASATLNYTLLRTEYVNGAIYGGSLSRDLYKSKVYADISYRYVNYQYSNASPSLKQNIAELSFSWRLNKKLLISADLEGVYESNTNLSGRLFFNIAQRF